jgi:AcrR family transcriptional regulator
MSEHQYMHVCQVTRYDRGMAPAPARPRNPRGEGARLRDQLVQATAEVLDDVGDASRVSVRAIARRAGVSPTALYLHFADRDALVAAAVDAGFAAFNAALIAAARSASDPVASLEAMGRAYLAFAERQPALYAVLFSARRPLGPKPPSGLGVEGNEGFAGLVALLRAADPEIGDDEATARAIAVWSSLHGFATLRAARPHLGWPAAEDHVRRTLAAHVSSPCGSDKS